MQSTETPTFETHKKVLTEVYAAINRNDIPALLKTFAPEIEAIQFEGSPSAGIYRGMAEVEANFSRARDTWAEGACNPEQFLPAGDRILVLVHVRVRLKNQTEWLEGRVTDAFTFRNGKITEMRTFAERQEALDWAGI